MSESKFQDVRGVKNLPCFCISLSDAPGFLLQKPIKRKATEIRLSSNKPFKPKMRKKYRNLLAWYSTSDRIELIDSKVVWGQALKTTCNNFQTKKPEIAGKFVIFEIFLYSDSSRQPF